MWLIFRQFNYCQLKCSKIRTLLGLKIISVCRQCCLTEHISPISVSITTKNPVFVKTTFLNKESLKQNIQIKSFCFYNQCHGYIRDISMHLYKGYIYLSIHIYIYIYYTYIYIYIYILERRKIKLLFSQL